MRYNRRNTGSGLFALVLMIVFISFFQREKVTHNAAAQPVISHTYSSDVQAVIVPAISSPGKDIFHIKKHYTKFTCLDYESGRELILNDLISGCYTSYQLEFHSNNSVIGLIFPQKIPERGNDDDLLPIT